MLAAPVSGGLGVDKSVSGPHDFQRVFAVFHLHAVSAPGVRHGGQIQRGRLRPANSRFEFSAEKKWYTPRKRHLSARLLRWANICWCCVVDGHSAGLGRSVFSNQWELVYYMVGICKVYNARRSVVLK